jgi:hypothetical protein
MGVDVPFGITGVEYAAVGSFTDPGKPDHQTAAINRGDGAVDQSGTFSSFSDAFGGVVGKLAHGHTFQSAGNYTIGLDVTDDDKGVGEFDVALEIVSPEAAIGRVIAEIDALLAGVTNPELRRDLQFARRALAGGGTGESNNGALDKLAGGEIEATIAKVTEAIDQLRRAQGDGADVSALIALLGQIVLALSAA